MELKIEDLKVGDELECIDRDGFNKCFKYNSEIKSFVIEEIDGDFVLLENEGSKSIEKSELKYFKKKEQSQQYTFDDLIDVAMQAVKDKVINGANIRLYEIGFMHNKTHYKLMPAFDCKDQIDLIKSLYKETFVIESEEDMKRIKDDAQITMTNGEILDYKDAISLESYINSFILKLLKGATVTQSK